MSASGLGFLYRKTGGIIPQSSVECQWGVLIYSVAMYKKKIRKMTVKEMIDRGAMVDGPRTGKKVSRKIHPVKPVIIHGDDYDILDRISSCADISMSDLIHILAVHAKEKNPQWFGAPNPSQVD